MKHRSAWEDPAEVEADQALIDSLLVESHGQTGSIDLTARIAAARARGGAADAANRLAEAERVDLEDGEHPDLTHLPSDLSPQPGLWTTRRAWLTAALVLLGFGAVLGALLTDSGSSNDNAMTGRQDPDGGSARVVTSLEQLRALLAEVTRIDVNMARRPSVVAFEPVPWIGRTDAETVEALSSDLRTEHLSAAVLGMLDLPLLRSDRWLQWTGGSQLMLSVPSEYYEMMLHLEDGSHIAMVFGMTEQSERVYLYVRGMPTLVSAGPQAKQRLSHFAGSADSTHGIIRKPADLAAYKDAKQLTLFSGQSRIRQPIDSLSNDDLQQLGSCTQLRRLDLSGMAEQLSAKGLRHLSRCNALRETLEGLNLRGVELTDEDFLFITDLYALRALDLSGVRGFTGEGFGLYTRSAVARIGPTAVDLSQVPTLTDQGLQAIAGWGLEKLRLAGSSTGITDAGWRALMAGPQLPHEPWRQSRRPAMTELDLSGWQLDAGRVQDLARHPTLERLHLRGCDLDDFDLAMLAAGLTHGRLRQLTLDDNPAITIDGLARIASIDDLETVSIRGLDGIDEQELAARSGPAGPRFVR